MSDDQLRELHDRLATERSVVSIDYYLDELSRRRTERQTSVMLWLTGVITLLTATNVVAIFVI